MTTLFKAILGLSTFEKGTISILGGKDENEKGNYYNIKIQIAPLDTNEMKLRCGMSANAEIKVSERRMIGYFFDNLKLRAHETFSMK